MNNTFNSTESDQIFEDLLEHIRKKAREHSNNCHTENLIDPVKPQKNKSGINDQTEEDSEKQNFKNANTLDTSYSKQKKDGEKNNLDCNCNDMLNKKATDGSTTPDKIKVEQCKNLIRLLREALLESEF